jgi:hypothetical protein
MLNIIPFFRPAIIQNEYKISEKLLCIRAAVTYAASAALAAFSLSMAKRFVPVWAGVVCIPVMLLDAYLSSRAAENLAVKDYIELENPNRDCINAIAKNYQLLKKVSQQGALLNKGGGWTLLYHFPKIKP